MRAESAAEQVIGGADVGDPVAHGLADGVFQRLRAGGDAADFSAKQPHAQHIQLLAGHVDVAHVDDAFKAEQGADGGGGHAVLARAGFGDDALLAHAFGQQALAEGVVDFVRAGVEQVFALEIDFGAAELLGQALAEVERRGAAGVVVEQISQFGLEGSIGFGYVVFVLQFEQGGHQGFRDVAAAVDAEAAGARLGGD